MLEPLQHLLAISLLHESIAQRGIKPLEERCGEQKGLHLLWLPLKHHLGQIVQDVALIPTGLLEQGGWIGLLRQGKAKQLQTHQPALRTGCHKLDRLISKPDAYYLLKEGSSLLWCTAQLVRAHFQRLLVYPQQRKG